MLRKERRLNSDQGWSFRQSGGCLGQKLQARGGPFYAGVSCIFLNFIFLSIGQ